MKIIIVGIGKVGYELSVFAAALGKLSHRIVYVDEV